MQSDDQTPKQYSATPGAIISRASVKTSKNTSVLGSNKNRGKLEQALFLNVQRQEVKIVKQRASSVKQRGVDANEDWEDVSDIEHNPKINNKVVRLSVNEERLHHEINNLNHTLREQRELIRDIETKVSKRMTERQMGDHFERITKQLATRVLQERLNKFKLADPQFVLPDEPNNDTLYLKTSIENFILGQEAILQQTLRNKRVTESNEERIQKLEDSN